MAEPLRYRVGLDTDFIIEKGDVRIELEWDASLIRLLADPPRDAKITLRDNETGQEIVWPLGSVAATPEIDSYAAIIAELDRLGWYANLTCHKGAWFASAMRKGFAFSDPGREYQSGVFTDPIAALQIVLDKVRALDRQPLSNYPPGADQLGAPEEAE